MKAKDLKSSYSFVTRRPYLEDSVFYVPLFYPDYESYTLPSFELLFGNQNPVYVEYCSGNGDWIAAQAHAHPEINWIAVEKRFDRVRKIWAKMKNRKLSNLLVVCGEAYTFTHHYLKDRIIDGVFIHFPDPWPKNKHSKHRLLQERFVEAVGCSLRQGKEVTIVTDDVIYLSAIVALFKQKTIFSPIFPAPHFTAETKSYGDSWFENLWREKGRVIHSTRFVRHADSN